MPEPKEVFQLRERILAFLEESLKESNTDVAEDDFRRLINNLIALVVFRNWCRSGTVSLFRTEYLQNRHESENRKLYAIELAPKDLAEVKKGPGERARIQKIQEVLERSHKNFYCGGVKVLGFSDQEMSLLNRFAKLRLTMGKEHKYLFAPLNATDDIDHIDQNVFTKNWAGQLPKQHGMSHLSINSPLYRKLMASYWKEGVSNPLHRDALNLHTGHSQSTRQDYYEVSSSKKRNAALASHYSELVLTRGHFSGGELAITAEPERDTPEEAISVENREPNSMECDHSDSLSAYESTNEPFEMDDEDDIANEDDSIDMPRTSNFPHAVPVTLVSSGSSATVTIRRPLDVDEIANFIKNRQQRQNRQKYTLLPEHYPILADLYIRFVQKPANFSALFRSKNLPMNIDTAMTIFKQVTQFRMEAVSNEK